MRERRWRIFSASLLETITPRLRLDIRGIRAIYTTGCYFLDKLLTSPCCTTIILRTRQSARRDRHAHRG
jgi:hypothetical protein